MNWGWRNRQVSGYQDLVSCVIYSHVTNYPKTTVYNCKHLIHRNMHPYGGISCWEVALPWFWLLVRLQSSCWPGCNHHTAWLTLANSPLCSLIWTLAGLHPSLAVGQTWWLLPTGVSFPGLLITWDCFVQTGRSKNVRWSVGRRENTPDRSHSLHNLILQAAYHHFWHMLLATRTSLSAAGKTTMQGCKYQEIAGGRLGGQVQQRLC